MSNVVYPGLSTPEKGLLVRTENGIIDPDVKKEDVDAVERIIEVIKIPEIKKSEPAVIPEVPETDDKIETEDFV